MTYLDVRFVSEVSGRTLSDIRMPASFRDGTVEVAVSAAVKDFVEFGSLSTDDVAVVRCSVNGSRIGSAHDVSTVVGADEILTVFVHTDARPPSIQSVPASSPASAVGGPAESAMSAGGIVASFPPVTPNCSASAAGRGGARSVSSMAVSSTFSPLQRPNADDAATVESTLFCVRKFVAGRNGVFDRELRQRVEDEFKDLNDAKRVAIATKWVVRRGEIGVDVLVRGPWSPTDMSALIDTQRIFQKLGPPAHGTVDFPPEQFSHFAPKHFAKGKEIPLDGDVSSGKTNIVAANENGPPQH